MFHPALSSPQCLRSGRSYSSFLLRSAEIAPHKTPAAPPQVVRVAFWNIQWFPGRHPFPTASSERAQTASVHRDMHKINADVLGMEEVRDFSKATIAVSPLRRNEG